MAEFLLDLASILTITVSGLTVLLILEMALPPNPDEGTTWPWRLSR